MYRPIMRAQAKPAVTRCTKCALDHWNPKKTSCRTCGGALVSIADPTAQATAQQVSSTATSATQSGMKPKDRTFLEALLAGPPGETAPAEMQGDPQADFPGADQSEAQPMEPDSNAAERIRAAIAANEAIIAAVPNEAISNAIASLRTELMGMEQKNALAHSQGSTRVRLLRLEASEIEGSAIRPVHGDLPLQVGDAPEFFGDDPGQCLLRRSSDPIASASDKMPSSDLPERSLSVEAWVAIDVPQEWGGILGAIEDNGEDERGWLLGFRERKFCFALSSQKTRRLTYLTAESPFTLGRFYHVLGTYDGKRLRLYVDGELAAVAAWTNSRKTKGDTLKITSSCTVSSTKRWIEPVLDTSVYIA